MTKYTGKDMELEFDGLDIPCLTQVDINTSIDIAEGECAKDTAKTKKPGLSDSDATVNFMLDSSGTTAAALLTALAAGNEGVLDFYPNGNNSGFLKISIANVISEGPDLSISVRDLAAGTIRFAGDGAVTYTNIA